MKVLFLFFLFVLLLVIFYCIAASLLKTPPFRASLAYKRPVKKTTAGILNSSVKWLARYIPMGMLQQAGLKKSLAAAGIPLTPKEYAAASVIPAILILLLTIPVFAVNPLLAVVPAVTAAYVCFHRYNTVYRKSDSRKLAIEKELPRFVAYMANELKSNRNVLELIDTYKANYSSPFTEELSITVSDMRTGNQEQALQRLETRINSPLLSELVRGLLSSLRGDDMATYFDNLGYKLADVWRQRLKQQTLKKEPKINLMSLILFIGSIITVFVVLGAAVFSSASLMGGMT